MAVPIDKKQMKSEPVISYEEIRDQLKTGQMVFCSGNYLFSGIIQKLTKSVWSHVAIVYKDENLQRILMLEAEPYIGIRLVPLSKYLRDYKGLRKPYKGVIFVADFANPIEEQQLNKAISFGLDQLTRPYDNWEIFRIMLRILFKIGRKENNRNYICSELVRDAFARSGIHFPLTNTYVSPSSIWNDYRVEKKYRIL